MVGDQVVQSQNSVTLIYPTDAAVQQFKIAINCQTASQTEARGVKNPFTLIHFRENAALGRGRDGIFDEFFEINSSRHGGHFQQGGTPC
jgi:hypothetical protein